MVWGKRLLRWGYPLDDWIPSTGEVIANFEVQVLRMFTNLGFLEFSSGVETFTRFGILILSN